MKKKMPQINTTNISKINITRLASASLATVVIVEAALSLVPVTVLVATVLEVFHGLSQEIFLLLALHERANHFQFLDINRLHPDPFLSDGLGEVLFLEPDLGLGFPFLVGDEGNITAIFVNVDLKCLLQNLLDILPGYLSTQPGEFQDGAAGQLELLRLLLFDWLGLLLGALVLPLLLLFVLL